MEKIRVLFNLYDISPDKGKGGGAFYFVKSLLKEMSRLSNQIEMVLVVNSDFKLWKKELGLNKNCTTIHVGKNVKILRPIVENIIVPLLGMMKHIDVLHTLFSTGLLWGAPVIRVITVYDLAYFFYDENYPEFTSLQMRYYLRAMPRMWRNAHGLIAISNFTKKELIQRIGIDQKKICAVLLGSPRNSFATFNEKSCLTMEQNEDIPNGKYFLVVASDSPNKNVLGLIDAVRVLVDQRKDFDYTFVVVGMIRDNKFQYHVTKDILNEKIKKLGLSECFSVRGFVSDAVLSLLYQNMAALVFPSIYEGFGIPVLEAFTHNKPVICSRTGSLPEVGGSLAVYFDPVNPIDVADKLNYFIENEESIRKWNFKECAAKFSFKKTAEEYLSYYRRLLDEKGKAINRSQ